MDIPAIIDTAHMTVSDVASGVVLALHGAQAIPAAFRDKPAPVDVRRAAYARFQDAACRSYAVALYLPEFARMNQRAALALLPGADRMMEVHSEANRVLAEILAATAQIRLVGGTGPAEAMRPVLRGLTGMYGSLPVGTWKWQREAKRPAFEAAEKAFAEALPKFTEASRIDLAYKRRPREHWWQLARPKAPKKADT